MVRLAFVLRTYDACRLTLSYRRHWNEKGNVRHGTMRAHRTRVRETTARGRARSSVGGIAVSGKDEFSILNVSTDHIPEDERRARCCANSIAAGWSRPRSNQRTKSRSLRASRPMPLPDVAAADRRAVGARVIRTKQLVVDGDDSLGLIDQFDPAPSGYLREDEICCFIPEKRF